MNPQPLPSTSATIELKYKDLSHSISYLPEDTLSIIFNFIKIKFNLSLSPTLFFTQLVLCLTEEQSLQLDITFSQIESLLHGIPEFSSSSSIVILVIENFVDRINTLSNFCEYEENVLLNNDRTVNDEKDNLVEPKLSFTQVDEKLNQLVSVPTINHASSPSNETAYDEYSRKEEIIDNIQCPSTDIIIDNLPSTFSSLNHTSNALLNVSLTLLPATQTIQLSPLNTVNNLQKRRLKCETNNFKESPGETTAIEDFTTAFSEFDALFFDHEKILSYEETVSVGIELGLDYQLSVLEDGCKRKEIESDNKERDGLLMKRAKV